MLRKTKHLNNDFLIKILYEKTCAVQPINVLYFFILIPIVWIAFDKFLLNEYYDDPGM